MPFITGQFATDFSPLIVVLNRLGQATMANPAMRSGMERAGEAYLGAMDVRFGQMESGGWRPLAARTVRQRIRQGFPGPQPILRRLGELRGGLQRGAPGNLFQSLNDRVRVGYGGGAVHSPYRGQKRSSQPTIAQVAVFNHPARPILAEPDAAAQKAIADAVASAVTQLLQAA